MKISFFFIAILITVAAFAMPTSAQANPSASQQVVANTNYASSSAAKNDPKRVPTNMGNYWDAKQWDREGGASFWHATTDVKNQPSAQRVSKNTKKGGRFVKKLFNR